MPSYRYTGKTLEGKTVRGTLNAPDQRALSSSLRKDGVFLVSSSEKKESASLFGPRKLKPMQLSEFCRQLSSMLGSGITLSRAMSIMMSGNLKPEVAAVYGNLQREIQQGSPLSEAMEHEKVFPEMMINMFRAGEASGQMEAVASKMATHYQNEHRMNNRIRSATLYPKILVVVTLAVVLIIFTVVMPTLEPFFEGMELPAFTRFLMGFSAFVSQKWQWVLLGAAVLFLLLRSLFRTPSVRLWWDRQKLHLPIVGYQLKIIYTARFSRTQSSLYSSGLSMIRSLEIAGATLGNAYLASQFGELIRRVRTGEMLSRALQAIDGFDPKLAPTVYVGEETGRLDSMLEAVANNYEYESDIALTRLTSLIEPVMIIVIAIIIGAVMLGVLVPIWSMYGNVG